MYRKVTSALLALGVFVSASAQQQSAEAETVKPSPKRSILSDYTPGSEFGFHAGPGFSIMYNQNPLKNPRQPHKPTYSAFAAGFTYQYNFRRIVSLAGELNIERKGDVLYYNSEYFTDGETAVFTRNSAVDRITYVTVPVTVKLNFGRVVRFFTNTGLYAGFRIDAMRSTTDIRSEQKEATVTTERQAITNLSSSTRTMDGGLVTGLGLSFPIGKLANFTVEARNNLGLGEVGNNRDAFPVKIYNNATSVLFGLSFNMSRIMSTNGNLKNISSSE